ncbi:hypothetical protein [Chamaesiphon sp. OTE_75_metabat_556]|uniref:hypothetical protein n=1 Tax=Chamaesiphon sp. OTE_75_metabat_556 TaxID=2964692 RepID=UPI00286A3FB9|nr:hypothetical protein [Chamaesiphon sp. OTE_75_metabat_556]
MPQRTIEITSYICYQHKQIGKDRNSYPWIWAVADFPDQQDTAIDSNKTLDRPVQ